MTDVKGGKQTFAAVRTEVSCAGKATFVAFAPMTAPRKPSVQQTVVFGTIAPNANLPRASSNGGGRVTLPGGWASELPVEAKACTVSFVL